MCEKTNRIITIHVYRLRIQAHVPAGYRKSREASQLVELVEEDRIFRDMFVLQTDGSESCFVICRL